MATRKFAIKPPTWKKLRKIKDRLNAENGRVIPWDEAFQYILKYFKMGGGIIYKAEEELGGKTPYQVKERQAKGLKAPKIPPKKIEAPKIPPQGGDAGNKSKKPTELEAADNDLNIPSVPMKDPIKFKASKKQLKEMEEKETEDIKYILIECQICGDRPISMPVPKKLVEEAKVPVVDVSYVHGDPKHVVVAQLDHDYQVRRRRASRVIFEE